MGLDPGADVVAARDGRSVATACERWFGPERDCEAVWVEGLAVGNVEAGEAIEFVTSAGGWGGTFRGEGGAGRDAVVAVAAGVVAIGVERPPCDEWVGDGDRDGDGEDELRAFRVIGDRAESGAEDTVGREAVEIEDEFRLGFRADRAGVGGDREAGGLRA